jgi:phenylacetate-CoA ligase
MARAALPDPKTALKAMLSHAVVHSPYYRDQAWAARLRAGEAIGFREIPITGKSLVRKDPAKFHSDFVPPEDGDVQSKYTSGSTGEPLHVRKTSRAFRVNTMENLRLKRGWGYQDHRLMANILNPQENHPVGKLEEEDLPDGRHWWKLYTVEPRAAFDLLRSTSATMVRGFPSVLRGALEHSVEESHVLPLRLVTTLSEVVPDELRELVRGIPGCRLVDLYGCIEAGLIALQCHLCEAYHPAERQLIFELITDEGRSAKPGELGRVVVTPLFNRAMPLLRYETGDYAVKAKSNDCPRSSVALERIVGRQQNLFKLPDGRRIMPRLPGRVAERLALHRFKLFQRTLGEVEFHYIPRDPGAEVTERVAQELIDMYMAPGFKVRCVRVAEIPRAPGGKYFMHESFV